MAEQKGPQAKGNFRFYQETLRCGQCKSPRTNQSAVCAWFFSREAQKTTGLFDWGPKIFWLSASHGNIPWCHPLHHCKDFNGSCTDQFTIRLFFVCVYFPQLSSCNTSLHIPCRSSSLRQHIPPPRGWSSKESIKPLTLDFTLYLLTGRYTKFIKKFDKMVVVILVVELKIL